MTDSGGTSGSVGDDLVAPVGTPSLGDLVSNQSDSNRLSMGQLGVCDECRFVLGPFLLTSVYSG